MAGKTTWDNLDKDGKDGEDRPKSKFFVKVGCVKKFTVPSTDTTVEGFVSLPQALFLDGMRKNQVNGESEYATQLACGNSLLGALLKQAGKLKPGEEMVTKLQVRIYRKKEEVEQTAEMDFSDMF